LENVFTTQYPPALQPWKRIAPVELQNGKGAWNAPLPI
jgi:hypothetical protein